LSKLQYLLDVNVLIALSQRDHEHHRVATAWFDSPGLDWGLCAFSEEGFLRVSANPKVGGLTVEESVEILTSFASHPGYRFWPIIGGWTAMAAPFSERIFGHKQITDAYLLGLAVKDDGILVTLDKRLGFLAGTRYSQNLLILG